MAGGQEAESRRFDISVWWACANLVVYSFILVILSPRFSPTIALNCCLSLVAFIRGSRDYSSSPLCLPLHLYTPVLPFLPTLFRHPRPVFSNSTVIHSTLSSSFPARSGRLVGSPGSTVVDDSEIGLLPCLSEVAPFHQTFPSPALPSVLWIKSLVWRGFGCEPPI